jgi:ATP/ADP translocase
VFVSLDYESRFVGKEIIGVFVNRFGRSAMAVVLSFAANLLESNVLSDKIFIQALSVSSLLWFYVSYPLCQKQDKVE